MPKGQLIDGMNETGIIQVKAKRMQHMSGEHMKGHKGMKGMKGDGNMKGMKGM